MNTKTVFGKPEEWKCFEERNSRFLEKCQNFYALIDKFFARSFEDNQLNRVVFLLGRLCSEDFSEILLLCGNGYGYGGMKILRGMYERVVNAAYISANPKLISDFLEFNYLHEWKNFTHAKRTFDSETLAKIYSDEHISTIEKNYLNVKDKYKKQISWSKLDLLAMSIQVGLDSMYLGCYYEPTLHSHSTFRSFAYRMKEKGENEICFDGGSQREKADMTLMFGQSMMLSALVIQNKHFNLGFDDQLENARQEYEYIWK